MLKSARSVSIFESMDLQEVALDRNKLPEHTDCRTMDLSGALFPRSPHWEAPDSENCFSILQKRISVGALSASVFCFLI